MSIAFKSMLPTVIQNQRLEFLYNPSIQQKLKFIPQLRLLIFSTSFIFSYAASTSFFNKYILWYMIMYIVMQINFFFM